MIRFFTFIWGSLLLLIGPFGLAQTAELGCGTETLHNLRMEQDPVYAARVASTDRMLMQTILQQQGNTSRSGDTTVYTIPVVFHVLHQGGNENISDLRIYREIQNINDGFRNRGPFANGLSEDIRIEFCLASVDPQGFPTNGIERIETPLTNVTSWGENQRLRERFNWDPNRYLNIYTTLNINFGGTAIAGVAIFPINAGEPIDGITILAQLIGVPNYPEESATMIHEIGHYLGLYHPFQDGCENFDCMLQGDRVCDTPPDDYLITFEGCGNNNNCNTDADDPRSINPFKTDVPDRNDLYMDYNTRTCRKAFSAGQRERMRAVMETLRAPLLRSSGCRVPAPYDAAVEAVVSPGLNQCSPQATPRIVLANHGLAPLRNVTIRYQVDGGALQSLGWSGNLQYTQQDTVALPSFSVAQGPHEFLVYTDFPNGQSDNFHDNDSLAVAFTLAAVTGLPYSVDFENGIPNDWVIDNPNGRGWEPAGAGCDSLAGNRNAVMMDNSFFYGTGFEDALRSPQIDLSYFVNTRLSFDVAYGFDPSFGSAEQLFVEVSTDCGESFIATPVYSRSQSGLATSIISTDTVDKWSPVSCGDWRRESVPLSLFDGQKVILRFAYRKWENGFPLYLDNIRVEGDPAPWTTLEEMHEQAFSVYPNPGQGRFVLESPVGFEHPYQVTLLDLPGRVIQSRQIPQDPSLRRIELDASMAPAGVYLLLVESATLRWVKKLVIQ